MDEPQVAPTDQPEQPPQPVESPPPEPATQTTAPEAPPATDAGLMRAFTQKSQTLSAVAAALGIPKTASSDQFIAAINERKQVLATADAELDADPRLAAQAASLRAREERLARQQYGASADITSTLIDAVRQGTSLLELTEIVDQHIIEAAASRFGASPAPAASTPAPQPQTPQGQAPERELVMEMPNGSAGMFTPAFTPDPASGPQGFFNQLVKEVPRVLGRRS